MTTMEIDGIPVEVEVPDRLDDLPNLPTALLVFGIGAVHEPLDAQGLTYAAAVAVTHPAAPVRVTVADDRTFFQLSCAAAELPGHLGPLCAAISAAYQRPVRAQTPPTGHPKSTTASLLGHRIRGAAPDRWPDVDLSLFSPEEIERHLRTHFTAGNARLLLTVPVPPGLRLALPPGPPTTPAPLIATPGTWWYADDVYGPGLSIVVTREGIDARLLLEVLGERVERGLAATGQDFRAMTLMRVVGDEQIVCTLDLQDRAYTEGHHQLAAEALWIEARRLADLGPAPGEVRQLDDVDPQLALEAYRQALRDTALVVVPRGVQPRLTDLREVSCWTRSVMGPTGQELKPPLLKRTSTTDRLFVTADTVTVLGKDGAEHTTRATDLLVVTDDDQLWLCDAAHHCAIEVSAFRHHRDRLGQLVSPRRRRTMVTDRRFG
ncbi:MAG: hypothetical protein HOV79_13775 [Hamadaea sp.]|nr:hypothetical protein [Hamadaea sp.]